MPKATEIVLKRFVDDVSPVTRRPELSSDWNPSAAARTHGPCQGLRVAERPVSAAPRSAVGCMPWFDP
jgi:hypothetical protein